MVVDRAKIERLEKELEEAKQELWKEDAERYRVLMRKMRKRSERGSSAVSRKGESECFSGLRLRRNHKSEPACVPGDQAGIWSVHTVGRKGLPKGVWDCMCRGCTRVRE
jgi:hypothetical protein